MEPEAWLLSEEDVLEEDGVVVGKEDDDDDADVMEEEFPSLPCVMRKKLLNGGAG